MKALARFAYKAAFLKVEILSGKPSNPRQDLRDLAEASNVLSQTP